MTMEGEKYLEIQPLLDIISKTGRSYDIDKIKQSFIYAKDMHEGQMLIPFVLHSYMILSRTVLIKQI